MWTRILASSMAEIRVNRLRSCVTGLCICIAVAAFSVVVQLGQSAQQEMAETVELTQGRSGTWRVTGQGAPLELLLDSGARSARDSATGARAWGRTLRLGEVGAVVSTPTNSAAPPERDNEDEAARPVGVALLAVDPGVANVAPVPMERGRWLTPADTRQGALPVVLSPGAAKALTAQTHDISPTSLVGRTLWVSTPANVRLTVVGLATDGPLLRFQSEGSIGFIPLYPARRDGLHPSLAGVVAAPDAVQTYLLAPAQAADLKEAAVASQRAFLSAAGHTEAGVTAERIDSADDFAAATASLSAVLGTIGVIALAVGVLGVANVSLMSVRERTREFGLRSALGASPATIASLVLTETALVIVAGGALGVLLAAVATRVAGASLGGALNGLPIAPLSFGTATVGIAASAACGLLAGILPAMRARRLTAIEAIRA